MLTFRPTVALILGAIVCATALIAARSADANLCDVCARLSIVRVSYPHELTGGGEVTVTGRVRVRRATWWDGEEWNGRGKATARQYRRCKQNVKVVASLITQISFSDSYGQWRAVKTNAFGHFSIRFPNYSPPTWTWSTETYLNVGIGNMKSIPSYRRGKVFCDAGKRFNAHIPNPAE